MSTTTVKNPTDTAQTTPQDVTDATQGDETVQPVPSSTGTDIDVLKAENATLKAELLKARVQARHGIGDDDARLFLTGADEATLTEQAEALAARTRPRGPVVPTQKNHPTGSVPDADPVRGLLGR